MTMKETKKRTKNLVAAFIIAITLTVIAFSSTSKTTKATTNETTVLVGDVNKDGIITGTDATLVLNYYTNYSAGNNNLHIDMLRADVDNNGMITGSDATLILQYYTIISAGGAIDWPPYETTTSTTTTKPTTTTTVASEFQIGDTVQFSGQWWNVRSSPQFSENIVSNIEKNDRFKIVGIAKDNWYIISNDSFDYKFIQIENENYYNFQIMSSSEIIPLFNIGNTLRFTGISWNKRVEPIFSEDNIISELENGDTFEIIGVLSDDWYYISDDGVFSYIQIKENTSYNFTKITSEPIIITTDTSSTKTTKTTTTTTTTKKTTTTTTSTTSTTKSELNTTTTTTTAVISEIQIGDILQFSGQKWNVRSSPQFAENVVSSIENNDIFNIVGIAKDNWYIISNDSFEYKFIQIENDISYIFNIVSRSEIDVIPLFNIGNNIKFNGISWNERTTPNFSIDNIVSELESGDTFEIIGFLADDWYLISKEGAFSYIQIKESTSYNFSEISSENIITTTTTPSTTTTTTTTTTFNSSIPAEMQLVVEDLKKQYPGIRIGIGVYTPNGSYTYNSNEQIYGCCTIKASYALYVLKQCEALGLNIYTEEITYQPWHYNDGSGNIKYDSFGTKYTIYDLLYRLITISDNTAYNILLERFSLADFFSYNRCIGGQSDGLQYGSASVSQRYAEWNQIINYINSDSRYADVLYNLLDGAYYSYLEEGMPSWHTVLHKSGWSTGSYTGACDVAYIDGKYLLIVMTDDKATGVAHTDVLWAIGNAFDRIF